MLNKLIDKIKELSSSDEGKRRLKVYAVAIIIILTTLVYNFGMKNSDDFYTTEYRETRGQRKARVQKETKAKVDKINKAQNKAIEQNKKIKEKLKNLQKDND